jgi:MoaA/NifB/PqqE/SkfB family radical SAM enzyme
MSDVYLNLFEYIISTGKRNIQSVIQTNGSLLKSKKELMINLLPYVSELRISFDAGSEETYKQTRVGGDWNRLLDNTEFIIDLIKQHKFNTRVYADFVVQKNNYKDLPLFATICRRLGVQMNIQKMWNWGTWDDTTFLDMNVYNPNHAEYSELQEYFKIAGLPIAKI